MNKFYLLGGLVIAAAAVVYFWPGKSAEGGMGMGMDRLLMALTGLGIRETILFALVK